MTIKKIVFIGLAIAVFLASLVFNVSQFLQSRKDKSRIDLLSKNTSNGQAKIINRYIHDSIEHVVTKEVFVASDDEKAIAVGGAYLDTLTRALNVAVNRIDEVTKVNGTLVAENLKLRRDMVNNSYHYSDKFLNLSFLPDSNTASLSYNVALNSARYWKRSWLLGAKQYYNDYFSDDQRVTINNVKRYTQAEERQKRLGIGGSLGYAYIPMLNRFTPYIGFGLNYNLKEF